MMRIYRFLIICSLASVASSMSQVERSLILLMKVIHISVAFQPMESVFMSKMQHKENKYRRHHQSFGVSIMDDSSTEVDTNGDEMSFLASSSLSSQNPELASILPGQVLSIRIGDTTQSRKAWKKRRRSKSPILVPCSVLGMDRQSMVTWNIMHLLHRFGKSVDDYDNRKGGGVALGVGACARLYKRTFGSSLLEHTQALGYPSTTSYFQSTFDEYHYAEYGVQFIERDDNNHVDNNSNSGSTSYLSSTLSLRRARESAFNAAFLQFLSNPSSSDTMLHTGATVIPHHPSNKNRYKSSYLSPSLPSLPLGAAIRLSSQSDLSSKRIQNGMDCRAFVLSYDAKGDNGSPLLICTIDSPKAQIREAAKLRHDVRRKRDWAESNRMTKDILARRDTRSGVGDGGGGAVMRKLEDLQVGDGPIRATVVRISSRAGAAFVDLGVERKKGKRFGGGRARVLGMLRLEDVLGGAGSHNLVSGSSGGVMVDEEDGLETWFADVEEDDDEDDITDLFAINEEGDETVDDITNFFSIDDEGNIVANEPLHDTPDIVFESEDSSNDDDSDDDDIFEGIEAEERLKIIDEVLSREEKSVVTNIDDQYSSSKQEMDSAAFLCVGNEIDVYIRGVFPQSGRFMVTLDSSIKGKKVKDLKRERKANKRLTRLAGKKNEVGGGESLQQILDNVGMECDGIVKAKSKKGDWYYVQPHASEDVASLQFPVGVAKGDLGEVLSTGDRVRVRLNGIDESRGQLVMALLKKI